MKKTSAIEARETRVQLRLIIDFGFSETFETIIDGKKAYFYHRWNTFVLWEEYFSARFDEFADLNGPV